MSKPRVFLALPNYDTLPGGVETALAFTLDATRGKVDPFRSACPSSLLANGFNALWCNALNFRQSHGLTHFAMLHADVVAEPGWLDILYEELERTGADVLSVVIPVKDKRGVTSTAIDNPANPWKVLRRLTLTEVHKLPETFGAKDAGYFGRRLLVNTGCWIARLDRPWCEQVHFTIQDRIVKTPEGRFEPEVIPEDWHFSRQVQDLGGRVLATRRVKLAHMGKARFTNTEPWGTWQRDEKYVP